MTENRRRAAVIVGSVLMLYPLARQLMVSGPSEGWRLFALTVCAAAGSVAGVLTVARLARGAPAGLRCIAPVLGGCVGALVVSQAADRAMFGPTPSDAFIDPGLGIGAFVGPVTSIGTLLLLRGLRASS